MTPGLDNLFMIRIEISGFLVPYVSNTEWEITPQSCHWEFILNILLEQKDKIARSIFLLFLKAAEIERPALSE